MNSASDSLSSTPQEEPASELKSALLLFAEDARYQLDMLDRQVVNLIVWTSDARLDRTEDAYELFMLRRMLLVLQQDTERAQTVLLSIQRTRLALRAPDSSSMPASRESSTRTNTELAEELTYLDEEE